MIALAAIAFIAIFFFNVPFPIIIIAAGVIGYFGAKSGRPEFAAIEHGGGGKKSAAVDSLLGEELPDHVRPSVGRALRVSAVWLLLWLVPVAALLIGLGQANVFSQIALFFSKMAMVTFGGAYAVLPLSGNQLMILRSRKAVISVESKPNSASTWSVCSTTRASAAAGSPNPLLRWESAISCRRRRPNARPCQHGCRKSSRPGATASR